MLKGNGSLLDLPRAGFPPCGNSAVSTIKYISKVVYEKERGRERERERKLANLKKKPSSL